MTDVKAAGWQRIDGAAFGLVYGAIMVLSILMAVGDHPDSPFTTAVVLFGSVAAIALAKAFAELLSHALKTSERLTVAAWRTAWAHSYPTLTVANVPSLLFLIAGRGWISADLAILLSQGFAVFLLSILGMRVGWVIDRRIVPAILGGAFAGGIGVALAVLKVLIH